MVPPKLRWFNPFFSCESILNNSTPFGTLSLGILRLRSLSVTILCFCLGLVLVNGACLCSGPFLFRCWVWFPAYCKDNLLVSDPTEWLQLCKALSALQGSQLPASPCAITRFCLFLPSCLCCKQLQLASSPPWMSFLYGCCVRGGFAITTTSECHFPLTALTAS